MTTAIEKQKNIFRAKNCRERYARPQVQEVRHFTSLREANVFIDGRIDLGLACSRVGTPGGYEVVVYCYAG